ncbi:MAG TPA: hypothetical protein PKU98_05140, partial [Saprospiraceae bacterium]|nr:hypothetical protein [Saprospiraceae bacterium]
KRAVESRLNIIEMLHQGPHSEYYHIWYDQIILELDDLSSKSKICKLLGVDAVISGRSSMSKPMTEIAAVAVGLISGAWGPTNSISNVLTIHDMKAKLLWKYDHNASGSVLTSPDSLIKSLMKNASRKFPFKK